MSIFRRRKPRPAPDLADAARVVEIVYADLDRAQARSAPPGRHRAAPAPRATS